MVGDDSVVNDHEVVALARCVGVRIYGSRLAMGGPPGVANDCLGLQHLQQNVRE